MYLLQRIVENTNITKQQATVHLAQFIHPDLNRLIKCAKLIATPSLNGALHNEVTTKRPNQQKFKGCVFMINSSDRYDDGGSCRHARRMCVSIYNIDKDYSPTIQPNAMSKYIISGEPAYADHIYNSMI